MDLIPLAVQFSPTFAAKFTTEAVPPLLDFTFIWIPFELNAARPRDEQFESGVLEARSHFTREIFAATMEQPDH